MTNKRMPRRDAQVIERALAGEKAASIAADMGVTKGRISHILVRNGLSGRLKAPGMPATLWTVRQSISGAWFCIGGGLSRYGETSKVAVERWKADMLGRRTAVEEPPAIVPARTYTRAEVLRLPPAMQQLARRAEAAQPRLMNMGSRVREGGAQ